MAREIPGFYYDEAKGKYFRIQPSHRVTPGTGYTRQRVRAAEQRKAEQRHQTQRQTRRTAETVDRPKIVHQTASPLFARLGASPAQNRARIVDEFARRLSCHPIHDAAPAYSDGTGFTGPTFCITPAGTLRAAFTPAGPAGADYILNAKSTYRTKGYRDNASPFVIPRDSELNYRHTVLDPASKFVTSLYCNGQECAVVTVSQQLVLHIRPFQNDEDPNPLAAIIKDVSAFNVEALWDIAAAPSTANFVLATNAGLIHGCCPNGNANGIYTRQLTRSEIMNVAFKDDNIVMSGERSGRINFTDMRLPQGNSVVRLLHSSAVLATLSLHSGHHVLTHGFSSTSTYDLRYVRQAPVKPTARSQQKSRRSTPLLDFAVPRARHSDRYSFGKKLAYSADLDLVAALSVNDFSADAVLPWSPAASFVTLYSARSGKVVDSPLTRHQYKQQARSVDIRRVRDGPESIFVLSGGMIDEWRVGGDRGSTGDDDDGRPENPKSTSKSPGRNHGHDDRHRIVRDLSIEQEWNRGNKQPDHPSMRQ